MINTIKWTLVVLNVISALTLISFGYMGMAGHEVTAHTTYRELKADGLLNELPKSDIARKLSEIGNSGKPTLQLGWAGAGACLINAVMLGFLCRKIKSRGN
jgi:hypothetical protein